MGAPTFYAAACIAYAAWSACTLAVLMTVSAFVPARAQSDYPNRPIRLIVGFAAGGGNDIFARVVADKASGIIGQPIVVENRPGAGGRLSAEYVSNQTADGYTLLVGATGAMSIAAAIYPNLKYHPTKTLIPLAMIGSFPLIMVIGTDNPSKNVKEFVEWAKQHPDKANYPSTSPAFTIATEQLKLKSGMPGVMIPYKSSNEMILSVMEGQTALAIADGPPTVPQVKAGKVKALAVTGASARANCRIRRAWRRKAIPASTFICGAEYSRRSALPRRSSPSSKRRSTKPSAIPAFRRNSRTWRSIRAADRPTNSSA